MSEWPDYVGIVDASSYGVGGVVNGELRECIPMVFRWEWPPDIKSSIRSDRNPTGRLTNPDLEMAGILLLWLVMEKVSTPYRRNGLHCSVIIHQRSHGSHGWHLDSLL
jgi:hypothetical protein